MNITNTALLGLLVASLIVPLVGCRPPRTRAFQERIRLNGRPNTDWHENPKPYPVMENESLTIVMFKNEIIGRRIELYINGNHIPLESPYYDEHVGWYKFYTKNPSVKTTITIRDNTVGMVWTFIKKPGEKSIMFRFSSDILVVIYGPFYTV